MESLIAALCMLLLVLIVVVIVQWRRRQRADAESNRQRQELQHLTRVAFMGQLSGALAHELTQPLTAILSNAQAAQRFLASDRVDLREVREILQDIVDDDQRAGDVIRWVRTLLRREEIQVQQLDVPHLVSEALSVTHSDLVVRGVDVICTFADGLPQVSGDRVQIQQVLLNLVLNAAEAMAGNAPRDRRLYISLIREGRELKVAVADCGTGIAPDQLERIFEAFYTTKRNGLGLGLAICRSIVAAHGGRLWAASDGNRGSTFYFTLPEAQYRNPNPSSRPLC